MVAPVLLTSTPLNGADSVATNIELKLEFSTPIDPNSVNGSVQVKDVETGYIYPIQVSVDANVVTIYVGRALEDYTRFELRAYGQDMSSIVNPIKSEDGDPLALSFAVTFLTARPAVTGVSEDDDSYYETIIDGSGNTIVEEFDKFAFLDSFPEDGTLFLDPGYFNADSSGNLNNPIKITFNQPIDPVSTSGAVTIQQRAFVDKRFAVPTASDVQTLGPQSGFASPSGNVYCPDETSEYEYPDFSVTVTGANLYIYMTSETGLRWNSQVRVHVSSSLLSTEASGEQTLGTPVDVLFTTGMFPYWGEIEQVRLELGEANADYTDFLISRFILRASIRAWRLACFSFDICNPPYYVNAYVIARAVYDIWTGPQGIARSTGKSKSLGDFSVRYGSTTGNSAFKQKIADLTSTVEEFEKWLKYRCQGGKGGYGEISGAVRGSSRADYPILAYRERHYHRESLGDSIYPGLENTYLDRAIKNPRINESYLPAYSRWGVSSYYSWL